MKRFATIRNVLIAIAFTVFLLFVKDNVDVVWEIICTIAGILTPFVVGFLFAYLLNFPYKFFYTKAFGKMAYMTKATAQLMRDLGSIQSPENAFLLNLGLETLHLRVPRHCENAQKIAEWLEVNPKVKWVNYCGLKSSKYYELAQKYMPNGSCGVIAFGLNGSREEAIKFMDALKLACIVTHVADARTCVLHPASHTHRQLTDEQLMEAGVAPDLIRLSVGIEDANDIIADLEQALEQIK